MRFNYQRLALCLSTVAALALYGCGGGGSDAPAATPPAVTTTDVPVTVVDGPIRNATVCLDKNNNGLCNAGEPTGKTGAGGKLTLKVDNADVGKFPILALVGTDSFDEDVGTITVPFTMRAPADKPTVVSPLTTLVQRQIASFGGTSAQAEATVKQQLGINISLFDDFTQSTSNDSKTAGTVARFLVVTTQQQSTALLSTVDTKAIDGNTITAADIDRLIQNRLLEILPSLMNALASPSVQAATTTVAKEAALLAAAKAIVADSSTGLTTTSVATIVAINNQTASTTPVVADTPAAGANLRQLNYSNSANWSTRINVATLAQATPDSAGFTRSVQRRYSSHSGNIAAWTTIGGSPNRQADLHFNGTAWVGCALNSEDKNSARDAQGNSSYNACDNFETGVSNRASFDVAGRSMLDVYNQINAAGYSNLTINNASAVLGTATFPASSRLLYQAATSLTTAIAYYPGTSNYVTQFSAAVSAGGIAANQAPSTGCNSTEFAFGSTGTTSTTLESLVTAMSGTPCVFA